MRIVSLVPSATSLIFSLGLGPSLVGVSHQCSRPPAVSQLPKVTHAVVDLPSSPGEIDQSVREYSQSQQPMYGVKLDLLRRLQPDVILTQDTCNVCSVSTVIIESALAGAGIEARVLPVNIGNLAELDAAIELLGRELGAMERARKLRDLIWERLASIKNTAGSSGPVPVLALEWVDPLLPGGQLICELVQIAGGIPVLPEGGHGPLSWDYVLATDPQVILIFPCGCSLAEAVDHARALSRRPGWERLSAVRRGRVYVIDGSVCTRHDSRIVQVAKIFHQLIQAGLPSSNLPSHLVKQWPWTGREAV